MRALLIIPAALLLSGCGAYSWVNSISASPDGKTVEVVGARYKQGPFGGATVDRPYRWTCKRADNGDLSCQEMTAPLPQMD